MPLVSTQVPGETPRATLTRDFGTANANLDQPRHWSIPAARYHRRYHGPNPV